MKPLLNRGFTRHTTRNFGLAPTGVKVSLTETQLFNSLLAALPTAVRVTRAPTEMVKL